MCRWPLITSVQCIIIIGCYDFYNSFYSNIVIHLVSLYFAKTWIADVQAFYYITFKLSVEYFVLVDCENYDFEDVYQSDS